MTRRVPRHARRALPVTLLLLSACSGPGGAPRATDGGDAGARVDSAATARAGTVALERRGDLLVLATALGPGGELRALAGAGGEVVGAEALPVAARLDGELLVCRRFEDGPPIHYLTFERSGERSAYGVYGLGGAKNDLPVDRPLGGDPIAWPGLDHEAALLRLLGSEGVGAGEARALVEGGREAWFGEGLRVLFTLDAANAARLPRPEGAPAARAALICVELPL